MPSEPIEVERVEMWAKSTYVRLAYVMGAAIFKHDKNDNHRVAVILSPNLDPHHAINFAVTEADAKSLHKCLSECLMDLAKERTGA